MRKPEFLTGRKDGKTLSTNVRLSEGVSNCVEVRFLGRCTVAWFNSMQARGARAQPICGVAGSLHTVAL